MILTQKNDFGLRIFCFLACIPSGGALLAKVYGVASMQTVTVAFFLPGLLLLLASSWWAARHGRDYLANALIIGFWGGFLGTLAYDLVRVPFLLLGQRIFAPINIYGIWLADAAVSTRATDLLGWTYHFANGITFGIMYALFMRRRHPLWAILWAFTLETIAILSPFAPIFNLSGNYGAIGIAYLGHVAYGLPLGWLVYKWDATARFLRQRPVVGWAWLLIALAILLVGFTWPEWVARDARAEPGVLHVEGSRLNPGWLRVERAETVLLSNTGNEPAVVVNKTTGDRFSLAVGERLPVTFERAGIYQIFVETGGRTRSSFVIVEPVEEIVS